MTPILIHVPSGPTVSWASARTLYAHAPTIIYSFVYLMSPQLAYKLLESHNFMGFSPYCISSTFTVPGTQ